MIELSREDQQLLCKMYFDHIRAAGCGIKVDCDLYTNCNMSWDIVIEGIEKSIEQIEKYTKKIRERMTE